MQLRSETEAALAAVDVAIDLMRRRVGADQVTSKGGRDLATGTDVSVEDAIRAELVRRFPTYPVVGEERGGESEARADRPYWLVDPICGTRNFASNLPLYCANVALVEDGHVVVAVIGDGAHGDRYVAERGRGAYLSRDGALDALRVTDASVTISIDVGASGAGSHRGRAAEFARAAILSNRWYTRMLGSAISLAHVAAGRLSAHVTFRTSSPLHVAAGALLAAEAGASVTDLDGHPWSVERDALLVAATPELHRELLALIPPGER